MRSVYLLFFAAVVFVGCNSTERTGLNPGDLAPEVSGLDLAGKPSTLKEQPGKVILLNFWATWCGPCVAELPALQRTYDSLKVKGFTVVGVAVNDTLEGVKEYRARYNLTFPMIVDEPGNSKKKFELRGVPESFMLDEEKKVIMVADSRDSMPVTRIVGPREWDSPQSVDIINKLLPK